MARKRFYKGKTHIAIRYQSKLFCGRVQNYNVIWSDSVNHDAMPKSTDWCKTCKYLYNANYAIEAKDLL